MSPTVLTIQTLGFITGTILFALLIFLARRAECPPQDKRARLVAAAMGLVWNLGSLWEYVLRLDGYGFASLSFRLARAVAYTGTVFLSTGIFMMLSVAPEQEPPVRKWRWALPLSLVTGVGLSFGFFAAALLPGWPLRFDQMMLLSAYNLGLHLLAGAYLFRQQQERSGYRVALLQSTTALALLLFLLIHFSLSEFWETTLMVIAQQSSLPMALIALAWLNRFRFADLFVKQSFLILTGVAAALIYQWFVVAPLTGAVSARLVHQQAAAWIVNALLWATLLLLFPLLRRNILTMADRWIFKRPDFRNLLRDFQQHSETLNDEPELFVAAERCVCEALRITEAKLVSVEAATTTAFPIRTKSGATYSLTMATGNRPLLSDEIALLTALTELIGRRLEAIQFERERRERQLREARLQHLLTESELKALRAQINPHFLFNTLNTIADLIGAQPDKAELMTERLAEVFRYVLSRTSRKLIPVSEEFEFLRTYLAIEQARFGERLRVEMTLDPTIAGVMIPPLILQPLVENAIKHGLATRAAGGMIRLAASVASNQLQLLVADDGAGWRSTNLQHNETAQRFQRPGGIGLQNVAERLQTLYGERAQMMIDSKTEQGTRITVTIPLPDANDETDDPADRRRSFSALAPAQAARRAS